MERLVREKVCDRCEREYDVQEVSSQEEMSEAQGDNMLTIMFVPSDAEAKTVEFKDLCKKCETRIDSLMTNMRMDKKEKSNGNAVN